MDERKYQKLIGKFFLFEKTKQNKIDQTNEARHKVKKRRSKEKNKNVEKKISNEEKKSSYVNESRKLNDEKLKNGN